MPTIVIAVQDRYAAMTTTYAVLCHISAYYVLGFLFARHSSRAQLRFFFSIIILARFRDLVECVCYSISVRYSVYE